MSRCSVLRWHLLVYPERFDGWQLFAEMRMIHKFSCNIRRALPREWHSRFHFAPCAATPPSLLQVGGETKNFFGDRLARQLRRYRGVAETPL
mmetsp:Transcript_20956/g.50257  ORF Transcript_20956/g.50257 Transcript_20956/m.50257 type:complete len:92 (+) Transcript_20956:80-355(+)